MSELSNLPETPPLNALFSAKGKPWLSGRDIKGAQRLIADAGTKPRQRIARTKAQRLALIKAIAAEMRADGRLPPLDLVDAFGAQ